MAVLERINFRFIEDNWSKVKIRQKWIQDKYLITFKIYIFCVELLTGLTVYIPVCRRWIHRRCKIWTNIAMSWHLVLIIMSLINTVPVILFKYNRFELTNEQIKFVSGNQDMLKMHLKKKYFNSLGLNVISKNNYNKTSFYSFHSNIQETWQNWNSLHRNMHQILAWKENYDLFLFSKIFQSTVYLINTADVFTVFHIRKYHTLWIYFFYHWVFKLVCSWNKTSKRNSESSW